MASCTEQGVFYRVIPSTLFSNDGLCTCRGYEFRGDCSHLRTVMAARCDFVTYNLDAEVCPRCGQETVVIDLE